MGHRDRESRVGSNFYRGDPRLPGWEEFKVSLKNQGTFRGAWVAQSVKRPTLGFGSGRDLMGCEFEP